MRRVGPQPPDPDWDRLDFRNPNGSRQAWGYLDPTDKVIVTNDGEVYVRVEKDQLEMKKDKPPTARFAPSIRSLIRRTFRWVSIIRRMYVFEDNEKNDNAEKGTRGDGLTEERLPSSAGHRLKVYINAHNN